MSDTIIHVKGLTAKVKLNNGEMLTTVNNVEFSMVNGKSYAIVGKSGSGPSHIKCGDIPAEAAIVLHITIIMPVTPSSPNKIYFFGSFEALVIRKHTSRLTRIIPAKYK